MAYFQSDKETGEIVAERKIANKALSAFQNAHNTYQMGLMQGHHLIPYQLFTNEVLEDLPEGNKIPAMMEALQNAGYDPNHRENLQLLPTTDDGARITG